MPEQTDIERLRELLAKATKAPWAWRTMGDLCLVGDHSIRPIVLNIGRVPGRKRSVLRMRDSERDLMVEASSDHPDAMLIAEARNALPALLAELEQHRATVAEPGRFAEIELRNSLLRSRVKQTAALLRSYAKAMQDSNVFDHNALMLVVTDLEHMAEQAGRDA